MRWSAEIWIGVKLSASAAEAKPIPENSLIIAGGGSIVREYPGLLCGHPEDLALQQ